MEEKKVTYSLMDKASEWHTKKPVEVNIAIGEDEKMTIKVKQQLSLEEKIAFAQAICDIVFCADSKTGEVDYRSAFEVSAWRFAVCKYCTNLKMNDFNRTYWFYSNDDIFTAIYNALPMELSCELKRVWADEVTYRKDVLLKSGKQEADMVIAEARNQNTQIKMVLDEIRGIDFNDVTKMLGNLSSVNEQDRVNAVLDFQRKEEMKNHD